MRPFGETILKHRILLEELTNEYRDKLIPVSTAVEVASRAMNFQTAYDFESCLAVMQEAFNVNDGYFVDSTSVVPVVRCKDCIHNNDCDIQYSAQAGDNFFCGFGETEKDVREDIYE